MTSRESRYFEERLLECRLLLLGQIEETKKSLKLLSTGELRDSGDQILKFNATNLLLGRGYMQNRQLRSVEEALDRLKRGEYGYCRDCGRRIGERRLTMIPWARQCLRCGQQEEKHDSSLGGPARARQACRTKFDGEEDQ
jgi:DnaK suppressor protein